MIIATDSFKAEIIEKYIIPSFKHDVKMNINNRNSQRKYSHRLDILAKVSTCCAGLASSAAIAWSEYGKEMNYAAIVLSTSSVVLHAIAVLMMKRAHSSNKQVIWLSSQNNSFKSARLQRPNSDETLCLCVQLPITTRLRF